MPETTEPQLTESDVDDLESSLLSAVDQKTMVSAPRLDALIRDWRAMRTMVRELALIVDVGTSDDPGAALTKIRKLQHDAATSMRDLCVAKVRGLRHKSEQDDSRWNAALYHAETQIQSLTLEQEQK